MVIKKVLLLQRREANSPIVYKKYETTARAPRDTTLSARPTGDAAALDPDDADAAEAEAEAEAADPDDSALVAVLLVSSDVVDEAVDGAVMVSAELAVLLPAVELAVAALPVVVAADPVAALPATDGQRAGT